MKKNVMAIYALLKQLIKLQVIRFGLVKRALTVPLLSKLPFDIQQIYDSIDFKPKGVIHVGGHLGQEVPIYKYLGIKEIVLFEPQPDLVKRLHKRYYRDPGVTVYQYALGSTAQADGMYLEVTKSPNLSASSSFLKPLKHVEDYPYIQFEDQKSLPLEIRTLDSFNITTCNFLVIDVQGYEMEVLKGATNTLNSIDYIICEFWLNDAYEGVPCVTEILDYLSKFGFTLKLQRFDRSFGDLLFHRA